MIKEFSQVGWFNPGSRRFEYTDVKDDRIRRGQGEDGYTVPVFAIDKDTASRLQVTLELAATTANKQSAAIAQIAAEMELAIVEARNECAPNAVKCLERWARQLRAL